LASPNPCSLDLACAGIHEDAKIKLNKRFWRDKLEDVLMGHIGMIEVNGLEVIFLQREARGRKGGIGPF
jgi:hypothetical protein